MVECEICQGSKHRWDEDREGYVDCHCLARKRQGDRYARAGVPQRFLGETWRLALKAHTFTGKVRALLREVSTLRQRERSDGWFLIRSKSSKTRATVAALILMAACDGGHECGYVTVKDMVDIEFDRQDRLDATVLDRAVLIIDAGQEPPHRWNRIVLENTLKERWGDGLFTVVITGRIFQRLEALYNSPVLEEFLRYRFKRVVVS